MNPVAATEVPVLAGGTPDNVNPELVVAGFVAGVPDSRPDNRVVPPVVADDNVVVAVVLPAPRIQRLPSRTTRLAYQRWQSISL